MWGARCEGPRCQDAQRSKATKGRRVDQRFKNAEAKHGLACEGNVKNCCERVESKGVKESSHQSVSLFKG